MRADETARILLPLLLSALILGTATAEATEHRLVASSSAPDGAPGWSPDGETIVFSSSTSGDWEIYTVGAWGGEWDNFSQNPEVDIYPNWSPAGGWIAFTSRRDNGSGDGDMDIWVQNIAGDSLRCLTDYEGYDNFAAFDPTGTRIAFSSDRWGETEIWVMPVDDPSAVYRVCTGPEECFHSCWSPDGQWIAFDGRDPTQPSRTILYRVPATGGPEQEIPTGMLVGNDPSWSPSGRYLAFSGGDHFIEWDLWVWDFETESPIQLTESRTPQQSPFWNAAGTEIVYAAVISMNKDVWVAYDLPIETAVSQKSVSELKSLFRR